MTAIGITIKLANGDSRKAVDVETRSAEPTEALLKLATDAISTVLDRQVVISFAAEPEPKKAAKRKPL